jgi:hypothetical protein
MKSFNLTIENPCHEDWSKMTPTQRGRFCGACERDLIDFSILTDAEVFKVIQANEGKVCGRFHKTQMNRDFIQVEERESPKYLKFAASLLLSLAVGNTQGQSVPKESIHIEAADSTQKPVEPIQKTIPPYTISGKVYDVTTNDPIPFSLVRIQGNTVGTKTDFDGNFTLEIPRALRNETLTLEVSHASFKTQEKILQANYLKEGYTKLEFAISNMLPEVTIVTLPTKIIQDEHIMGIPPLMYDSHIEVKRIHWWQFRKRRQLKRR